MTHKDIILQQVEKYNGCQSHQYRVVRWPDEENRKSRDIDAYAEAAGAIPLAIEHTKVESLYGQLADNERFGQLYGEIESQLKNAFDFELHLILPLFAFQKGTKWAVIRDLVRDWLLAQSQGLPQGRSSHRVPGVPFTVTIIKDTGGVKSFFVARRAPSDRDIQIEMVQNIVAALEDKNSQLSKYRTEGAHTILILESLDIALVSHISFYKSFLQAQQCISTPNIDEVWFAHTFEPENYCDLHCLSGPEQIMDCINPENFLWGPRYAAMWAEAIIEDRASLGSVD
jgi:hypothetical protein